MKGASIFKKGARLTTCGFCFGVDNNPMHFILCMYIISYETLTDKIYRHS